METGNIVKGGVGVLILREGKVLLGHRHDDPEKADSALGGQGSWTMPGGKIDFGESFETVARREVMEETGLTLPTLRVFCLNNNKTSSAQFVTVGLICEDSSGEPQVLEPDEITEWRWFDIDALPSPMYFPSAKMIENYKAGQFYLSEQEQ